MKLAIVRHGEAAFTRPDAQRALTPNGQLQAQALAQQLALQHFNQPKLWASPYARAQQTAQAIADSLTLPVLTQEFITPNDNPALALTALLEQQQDIILVAHLPLVGRLASLLIDGQDQDTHFQPAECWLLHGELLARGCMELSQRLY